MGSEKVVRFYKTSEGDYSLEMWEFGKGFGGERVYVEYALKGPDGKVIFSGNDFSPGSWIAWDSDKAAGALLGSLTLGKGDTDSEYFDLYTPEQIEWRDSGPREELAIWGMELEGELGDEQEED